MEDCIFFPASLHAMLFDNQIPCPFYPSDTIRHVVGHNLNMCPKRPKIGNRTVAGHVVGHNLNMCPKSPKIVRRTLCRSYAQTLSDFSSKGVRNLAAGQSRTQCRTQPRHVSETSESW